MPDEYIVKDTESFERSFKLDRSAIDEESRTIRLAFSSETPVARWEGDEILDHSPESIRMGRMRDGGAVLVDHDPRDHIGTVESVSVDNDRKARAVVRLGNSARATEIWNDIKDGIRKHISVGYRVYKAVVEDVDEHGNMTSYRVTDWEPHEISFVSIPADPQAAIGRSLDIEERIMPTPEEAVEVTPAVDTAKIAADAREAELDRIRTIESEAADLKAMGLEVDARSYIADGKSVDEFRVHTNKIMRDAVMSKHQEPVERDNLEIGMNEREVQTYSLMNALRAAASGDWSKAGFERECSIALADKMGREARGFFVPFEVMGRAQNVGTDTAGGHLVATDHMAGNFIEALRANTLIGQLGATYLDGLVGNVDIPKQTGVSTFYWLAEGGDVTDSAVTLGNVTLTPKTVAGSVDMTRRLIKQSAPSIEALILNDLVRGAALAIDAAAFAGTGASNQPTGIINTTGVSTQTVADVTNNVPTFAELVGFETALANDNALTGSLAYVATPSVRAGLKTTAKDSGSGIFLLENNMANGYDVYSSTNIPAGTTIFGNFNDLLVGMWGVLDVAPDPAKLAASGGMAMRVFQDVDIAVRRAESFCINA